MIPFKDLDNLYLCIINVDIETACDILAKYFDYAEDAARIRKSWKNKHIYISKTNYSTVRIKANAINKVNREAISELSKVHTTAVTVFKKFIRDRNFITYKLNSNDGT